MKIQTMDIRELTPAAYNPREDLQPGDEKYEQIKRSIEEFDYIQPIIYNERTQRIVGGHQRQKIMIELERYQAEVVIVDWDEQKEKAANLALNKIDGEWAQDQLAVILNELETGWQEITGFDPADISELVDKYIEPELEDETEFDFEETVEEVQANPITQPGDIWTLGEHKLICGDTLNREHVERLLNREKAGMVWTDPPYNVDYVGKTKDALKIQNDKMADAQFYEFLLRAFSNLYAVTKIGGPIYIAHADSEGETFRRAMRKSGYLLKQNLIWVKNTIVMGRQDYHWQHEPILYGWKPGGAHSWHGARDKSTVIDNETKTKDLNKKELIHLVNELKNQLNTTVIRQDKPSRSNEHPTMKPPEIIKHHIENSTTRGEIVLDGFGGSGSTLIAAEQLRRRARIVEFDPIYCDVIVARYEKYTGKQGELFREEVQSWEPEEES